MGPLSSDFFRRSGWRGNLLLVLPFLTLFYIQLAHHVMWRDEMNPWGIAYVSPTLGELLRRVHYEAHPALWYVILWLASRFTHAVWMLKLIQGAIGTGIFLTLALTTPFRRLEQLLIYAGFYISFEYTVMARMYGIEVLAALLYIWFRMNRPQWRFRNVLWLCLIANVDSTAAILASGLLVEYLLFLRTQNRIAAHATDKTTPATFAGIVTLYTASIMLCVGTLWPTRDIGWVATGKLGSAFSDPTHLGCSLAFWGGLPWFPQSMSPVRLWDDLKPWPQALLVPIALTLLYLTFRRHRREGVLYSAVLILAVGFSQITSVAALRHIGMMYITFLLCLWQMRFRGEQVSRWSYVLLALAVLGNVQILLHDRGRPLADDDAAASWIRDNRLQDMPLLASPDALTIGVPIRLDRPVYQLDCNCVDRVLTFSRRRDAFNDPQFDRSAVIVPRTLQGMQTLGARQALLITNEPLTTVQLAEGMQDHLGITLAASFDRGVLTDEHFFLYRLAR